LILNYIVSGNINVAFFGGRAITTVVASRLIYGAVASGFITTFFVAANFNSTFFNQSKSAKDASKFLERFDNMFAQDNRPEKDTVRKTLQLLLEIAGATRPDTNYFYMICLSALSLWTTGDGLHAVCLDWTKIVADAFAMSSKEKIQNAKKQCLDFGVEIYRTNWKSVANDHFTICIKIKCPNGETEYWQIDDGWEFNTVGSPFPQACTPENNWADGYDNIDF
jgi:hypothetical protein